MARWGATVGLALVLSALVGCGAKTYPVTGKVTFDKGDVKQLAGSIIICKQEKDPLVMARGELQEDGSFTLETHSRGKILPGAFEGTYRAWITFNTDNGDEEVQFRKMKVDPKFFSGRDSPLTFQVPTTGEVVLPVTRSKPGAKLPIPKDPTGC